MSMDKFASLEIGSIEKNHSQGFKELINKYSNKKYNHNVKPKHENKDIDNLVWEKKVKL